MSNLPALSPAEIDYLTARAEVRVTGATGYGAAEAMTALQDATKALGEFVYLSPTTVDFMVSLFPSWVSAEQTKIIRGMTGRFLRDELVELDGGLCARMAPNPAGPSVVVTWFDGGVGSTVVHAFLGGRSL